MKKIAYHTPYYLPLLGMLLLGLMAFVNFSYDKSFQKAVLLSMCLGYVAWGVIYHTIHKDINAIQILEYVTIAIFGATCIFLVLF